MKIKIINIFTALSLIMISGCAGAAKPADAQNSNASVSQIDFSDMQGKDWNLAELQIGGERTSFSRSGLAAEGFEQIFTIRFEDGRVSGIGAPNRFFAPYALGEGDAIKISTIAGTLMAAFREPEQLREHEYFSLLQNVSGWNFADGRLILRSANESGAEALLIFTLE